MVNREDLIEHIKKIGQAIIDDAERIAPETKVTKEIEISAKIRPNDLVTTIHYDIERIADPRLNRSAEHDS